MALPVPISRASWSPQQELALGEIRRWLQDRTRQVYYLAGYAGTGKTTLAREVRQMVAGTTQYAAYTGKAASVLRAKGCENATTLHSLLYKCEEQVNPITGRNELRFVLRRYDSPLLTSQLLVLDEVSMVNDQLAGDVRALARKILVLGDPEQLPPVEGQGYFTARAPDRLLTEIHRQARENPIIRYHKAQGSEWPTVTVWDDGFGTWTGADPHLRRRWLYTACTRASERVTIYARD